MNTKDFEKRVKYGTVTYWKDGVMVARKCTKCGEDKEISEFYFRGKRGVCNAECKKCQSERASKWTRDNLEKTKERRKKRTREWKDNNREKVNESKRKWAKNNPDKIKEMNRKYIENNIEKIREKHHQHDKKAREKRKESNLQKITNLLEQINPIFEQLNLPVYGYIYKIENIKTGRVYIGQTIHPLNRRYGHEGGIIKAWIKERLAKNNQKFVNELIAEDIEVTEVFDVAFSEYHLNRLESYYISKYDSYNNGYNNTAGNYNTDDGIEEFNQILTENGLEFKNGKLIQIKNTHHNG